MGAPGASHPGRPEAGASYVIYGRKGGYLAPIDLADLNAKQGSIIQGAASDVRSGWSVSTAGDINGDGISDVIVGAPGASHPGRPEAGASYVIYGRKGGYLDPIDLADLNAKQGVIIQGAASRDWSGYSVSSAGDINGDGISDVIVGASLASPNGRPAAGASYVIYGRKGGYLAPIDLAGLNAKQGVIIQGAASYDHSGWSVSTAGDINGDGISDVIVGASLASPEGRQSAGTSYVIYGRKGGYLNPIDLAGLNATQGVIIQGAASYDHSGWSVSTAGDINGDGISDVIVGAENASPKGRSGAGTSYVIYGRKGGYLNPIDLAGLNATQGVIIQGAASPDGSGTSVSTVGDINGDGISDVIVGASLASPKGRSGAGTSYVIYGQKGGYLAPIDLADLNAKQGVIIQGAASGDRSGISVSSAGDINGDGISDVIVGASLASPEGRPEAGTSYVIYGQKGFPVVDDLADKLFGKELNDGSTSAINLENSIDAVTSQSASTHEIPWYSPARWMGGLKSLWQGRQEKDAPPVFNAHVRALLALRTTCEEALKTSSDKVSDKWYGFSLEDMIEDMTETLQHHQGIDGKIVQNFKSRLHGIKKDFLYGPSIREDIFMGERSQKGNLAFSTSAFEWAHVPSVHLLGSASLPSSLGK